jgi:hypothetical protein
MGDSIKVFNKGAFALVDKDNESQNARRGNYVIITEQNTDEQNIAICIVKTNKEDAEKYAATLKSGTEAEEDSEITRIKNSSISNKVSIHSLQRITSFWREMLLKDNSNEIDPWIGKIVFGVPLTIRESIDGSTIDKIVDSVRAKVSAYDEDPENFYTLTPHGVGSDGDPQRVPKSVVKAVAREYTDSGDGGGGGADSAGHKVSFKLTELPENFIRMFLKLPLSRQIDQSVLSDSVRVDGSEVKEALMGLGYDFAKHLDLAKDLERGWVASLAVKYFGEAFSKVSSSISLPEHNARRFGEALLAHSSVRPAREPTQYPRANAFKKLAVDEEVWQAFLLKSITLTVSDSVRRDFAAVAEHANIRMGALDKFLIKCGEEASAPSINMMETHQSADQLSFTLFELSTAIDPRDARRPGSAGRSSSDTLREDGEDGSSGTPRFTDSPPPRQQIVINAPVAGKASSRMEKRTANQVRIDGQAVADSPEAKAALNKMAGMATERDFVALDRAIEGEKDPSLARLIHGPEDTVTALSGT